jgi:hypothetical protein
MDRPEEEPLMALTFFRGTHDSRSKKIFFTQFRRNLFRKIIFFGHGFGWSDRSKTTLESRCYCYKTVLET